ncbi:MAG: hypothetical protein K8T89_10610 [Planctomycetes bacterium]|nr:hypothetical protein [Planctomycetota bacterium]
MRTIILSILALAIFPLILQARPAPKFPNQIEPTVEQLAAAKEAFAKLGAKYECVNAEGVEQSFHVFYMPKKTIDADLKKLPDLPFNFVLSLTGTKVTDDGLKELKSLKNLFSLYLSGDKITDRAVNEIKELKKLASLSLCDTKITKAGVMKLREALPTCVIHEW